MTEKQQKGARKSEKKRIYRKLRNKFRLVIMNDETFEEKFSLILSPLNVFSWGGFILLVLIMVVSSVIAFTPLREYIPGYSDVNMKRMAAYAALKADSLETALRQKDNYMENLRAILGDYPRQSISEEEAPERTEYDSITLKRSKEDSLLREQIESEDAYNLFFRKDKILRNEGIGSFFFFTPLKGIVSASFNPEENHYGVDIVAPRNEAIKAMLDGTVVFAGWTSETGHVIQLQHENNLLSVYKHNSVLLKNAGERVKAGEVIAILGESGELTSGPHLHFELWYNGNPVDPQEHMIF